MTVSRLFSVRIPVTRVTRVTRVAMATGAEVVAVADEVKDTVDVGLVVTTVVDVALVEEAWVAAVPMLPPRNGRCPIWNTAHKQTNKLTI